MVTEPIKPWCGYTEPVQLEMDSDVPTMQPGERYVWHSSGKQRFIHHTYPKLELDDDGNIIRAGGGGAAGYKDVVPGFEMSPRAIQFHRPDDSALCILEGVLHLEIEQIVQSTTALLEIFLICAYGPLAIAWPTFSEDKPLALTFHNPMKRVLPSFSLSLFLDVPKDFASRWRRA